MTNKKQAEFKSFDEYVSEAEVEPFELPVSKDETLVIEAPTGARIEQFARAYREGDIVLALWALAGDSWPRLEELTNDKHFDVRNAIMNDLVKHFELVPTNAEVELRGPGGGTIKESDPQRIQQLQQLGFVIVGESQPR